MWKYSSQTGGFYRPDHPESQLPEDCVDVTAEHRRQLLQQEAVGKVIAVENDEVVAVDPPQLPLTELKAIKLQQVNVAAESVIDPIISQYPRYEIDSWQKQVAEAHAFIADNTAITPWLDSAVSMRPGKTKAELANRILQKEAAFGAISGYVSGQRQALEDAIDAAADRATLDAITINITLPPTP